MSRFPPLLGNDGEDETSKFGLHLDRYHLSQFYELYDDFLEKDFSLEPIKMPVARILDEKMNIDWIIGNHLALLAEPATEEIKKARILTAMLGFSSYDDPEAFPDEKLL